MDADAPELGARRRMVERQIAARGVVDERVLAALREVPRERFVPDDERRWAFDDHPLPIGRGQTISQPYIVALMTEALAPQPGDRVFEVGAGSGYQSAVLARLGAEVCALERDPVLAARARATLAELEIDRVDLRCGDGFAGWPEPGSKFERILVACAARQVPEVLLDQLAAPGRLVLPLGGAGDVQELLMIDRDPAGRLSRRSLGLVRFVPMVPGVASDDPSSPLPPAPGEW